MLLVTPGRSCIGGVTDRRYGILTSPIGCGLNLHRPVDLALHGRTSSLADGKGGCLSSKQIVCYEVAVATADGTERPHARQTWEPSLRTRYRSGVRPQCGHARSSARNWCRPSIGTSGPRSARGASEVRTRIIVLSAMASIRTCRTPNAHEGKGGNGGTVVGPIRRITWRVSGRATPSRRKLTMPAATDRKY
ncbi:MAG: hypothetical protein H6Q90_6385 [Deltaproteobacteria bacterium]|nr:hypothetical protein [Deltaproteobacteria bacterium]